MRNNEFRILITAIFVLCMINIVMGLRIESLQNERYNETSTKDNPAVSDSLPDGGYCCMERLR